MIKKHYKGLVLISLLLIWAGWIVFLDTREPIENKAVASGSIEKEETSTPSLLESKAEISTVKQGAVIPAQVPTTIMTQAPTAIPTQVPTAVPTQVPTAIPTQVPTAIPAQELTAIPTQVPTEVPAQISVQEIKFEKVITNVMESLNIRSEASENGRLVGKLGKDAYGDILLRDTEWTKIKSGSIIGYVYNEYLYMDEAAINRAKELDALYIEADADIINIRVEPNTECDILGKAELGETYVYIPEKSTLEWYAVEYNETIAYMSSDLCKIKLQLETATAP